MSSYIKPGELEKEPSCAFVTKHPVVFPSQVQPAPVFCLLPVPGFVRMGSLGILKFPMEHPFIQVFEDRLCHSYTEVVGPSPDNGVEPLYNCDSVGPKSLAPFFPQSLPYCLYRFFAWLDKQFVPRPACLGGFVVSNVKTKKVKSLCQVDDTGLFL